MRKLLIRSERENILISCSWFVLPQGCLLSAHTCRTKWGSDLGSAKEWKSRVIASVSTKNTRAKLCCRQTLVASSMPVEARTWDFFSAVKPHILHNVKDPEPCRLRRGVFGDLRRRNYHTLRLGKKCPPRRDLPKTLFLSIRALANPPLALRPSS